MTALLRLVVPAILLALAGSGAAFHASVRDLGIPARAALAFLAGAVALTVEGVLFTLAGIAWSPARLFLPLLALSVALGAVWNRRARRATPPVPRPRAIPPLPAAAALLAGSLALAHLAARLATMRATSVDYLFFWGVKAARFAAARGIDVALLRTGHFYHAVPTYPPLVPVVGAWRLLWTGTASWRLGVLDALVWLVAAVPLVLALLRRALPDATAAAVTAFWTAALAVSFAFSFSGGSAEPALLVFESVAGAAVLVEAGNRAPAVSRFLPALALAGAALTKVEGLVGALALAGGTLLRDRIEGKPRGIARALPLFAAPLAATGLWFGFQAAEGLQVGYVGHGGLFDLHLANLGGIIRAGLLDLRAGCAGLSWLLPLAFLVFLARRRAAALPGLVFVVLLFLFLGFDYLHDAADPWQRVGWTLPRVSQPALSLFVLAAGVATGRRAEPRSAGA